MWFWFNASWMSNIMLLRSPLVMEDFRIFCKNLACISSAGSRGPMRWQTWLWIRNCGFHPFILTSLQPREVNWNALLYFLMSCREHTDWSVVPSNRTANCCGRGGNGSGFTFLLLQHIPLDSSLNFMTWQCWHWIMSPIEVSFFNWSVLKWRAVCIASFSVAWRLSLCWPHVAHFEKQT